MSDYVMSKSASYELSRYDCVDNTPVPLMTLVILIGIGYRLRQKSWSPSSVSCVATRTIVRRSVWGPVRDIN